MGDDRYAKIVVRINDRAKTRLETIRRKFDFRSNYEIMQYLLTAFLRYADPGGEDAETRQDADDISRLFADLEHVESRVITTRPVLEAKSLGWAIGGYNISRKKSALARCIRYRPDGINTTDRYDAPLQMVISEMYPRLAAKMDRMIKSKHLHTYEDLLLYALDHIDDRETISEGVAELFAGFENSERPERTKTRKDREEKPSIS